MAYRLTLVSQYQKDIEEKGALVSQYQKDIEEKCALMSQYQKDIEEKCALVSQYQKDIEEKCALRVSDKLNMPTTRTSVISIALVKCSSSVLRELRAVNKATNTTTTFGWAALKFYPFCCCGSNKGSNSVQVFPDWQKEWRTLCQRRSDMHW